MKIEIRRVEPGDYKAVQQVHAQPRAVWGTLQLPFPSEEECRRKHAGSIGMAVHAMVELAAYVDAYCMARVR